jgi:hypothetical protein
MATDSAGTSTSASTTVFPNLCANGQARGQYFTNQSWSGAPAISRCDTAVNFPWGLGGPFGTRPVDHFSVEWHSARYFPAGTSTVSSTSDDGMQTWIDGNLVIDNNGVHPPILKAATVNFPVAGYHDVLVRYYENTGGAVARVSVP